MLLLLLACGPSSLDEATRYDDIARLIEGGALSGRTELALRDRGLGPELGELIAGSPNELVELDLRGNLLGPRGAMALAESSELGDLETLILAPGRVYTEGNRVGDAGAIALTESSTLVALRKLDLTRNELGPKAAAALAEGPPALRVLILDSNALGDAGAEALAGRELDTLHVGWNGIGDEGAAALADGSFTTLMLAKNDLGQAGADALAEGLTKTETLYLGGNAIAETGRLRERFGEGLHLE